MQIGNRSFHIHDQNLFLEYSNQSKSKERDFLFSPTKSIVDSQWRPKTIGLKTSGTHVSLGSNYNADEIVEELRAWVGKPTTVIAYSIYNLDNSSNYGCACGASCEDCNINYLQTYGILKSVERSIDEPQQPHSLSISIDILDFWRELDNYSWEWGDSNPTSLLQQSLFISPNTEISNDEINYDPLLCNDYFSKFPTCEQLFACDPCGSFHFRDWANTNLYYDEYFWYDQYNEDCVGRSGGESDLNLTAFNVWNVVDSPAGKWSAPPLSIYSLSGLPPTGTLTIRVVKKNGISLANISSSIDLAQLDADLIADSLGGLEIDDRIVVGDIRRFINDDVYRPAFIERGSTILATKPRWDYSEWFPGMLAPNYSQFAFNYSGSGDTSHFNAACVHHFRRI
jgi:hypothetical protein